MKKQLKNYLENDDSLILKIGIATYSFGIGEAHAYAEICGSFIEGVHQWATHSIIDINEVENQKYTGWVCRIDFGGYEKDVKIYVPNWVLEAEVKDFKHAKNLFLKYLKRKNEDAPVYAY
jgi:hypothetical protein